MGRFLSRLISVNSHWEVGALQIDLSFPAFSFPIQIFSKATMLMVMIMMMLLLMYKMATLMMGSPTNFPHCTSDLNPASLSCHELSPVSLPTNCPMQCHMVSPHDFLKSFVVFSCPSTDEWPQSLHLVLTWFVPTNPPFPALPHIAATRCQNCPKIYARHMLRRHMLPSTYS